MAVMQQEKWHFLDHAISTLGTPAAAAWVSAIATLVLAAIAIFGEDIRRWRNRPKLSVSIKMEPPDCVEVPALTALFGASVRWPAYWLRLFVKNCGNTSATSVEVYARELRAKGIDGMKRVKTFPPMNLKWSHGGGGCLSHIAPGTGKHCGLGHMFDPKSRGGMGIPSGYDHNNNALAIALIEELNHHGHVIGPGEYELDITISAENARPVEKTLGVFIAKTWYSDEMVMFKEGVRVNIV